METQRRKKAEVRYNFKFEAGLHRRLKILAAQEERTLQSIMNEAMEKLLEEREEKQEELAAAA